MATWRVPAGPGWWKLPGRGRPPKAAMEPAYPTLIDPLNYDPHNIPSLIGPQVYWSSVASNFMPAVRDPNVIASTVEAGITMNVQPVIDYTPAQSLNPAVGNPNMITGDPPQVQMSKVVRAFEEQLITFQDFLLGTP